ncbi:MAG: DUF4307 domain-containing protein [Brevibacterium aurantiacum]|uniref:DUF4307 domain-containing protein n=1 Tax=Brevibacterium aurantiacum TaxID=273384 RepID=UPI0005591DC5|nr:DUF4307 domain-containing protein [Brevibacterium aurantiacum]MDN5738556.1 DUF4307 domain-containing protein [Brevibacterium aurantiacum]MDN5774352.1 DUF4307 domain-containing protein [Brevibacterium aurantiacum]
MTEITVEKPLHDDRYGRARAPKRRLGKTAKLIAAVIVSALIVAIGFVAFRPQTTPTTPKTLGYSVVDSSLTRVSVAVFPDQDRDVHCIVQATNDFEAIVGFTEVSIPADPAADPNSPRQIDIDLATTQFASSGHADACWFE